MTHEVVYIGGPAHGDRLARPGHALDAAPTLTVTCCRGNPPELFSAVYVRREMADVPGAIAYVYDHDVVG